MCSVGKFSVVVIIYGAVLLVALQLGLVPMWLKARQRAGSLAEADRRLTLVRVQHDLASADRLSELYVKWRAASGPPPR